jgi:hypothetical protein
MGRYVEAQGYVAESLAIARQIGDKDRVAAALVLLAMVCPAGTRAAARGHLEEALALARGLGHTCRLADALNSLAELERLEGDLTRRSRNEESLALDRKLGDRDGTAAELTRPGFDHPRSGGRAGMLLEAFRSMRKSDRNTWGHGYWRSPPVLRRLSMSGSTPRVFGGRRRRSWRTWDLTASLQMRRS